MLQICPKLPNQQFEELPFEEAILTFLRDLGHSGEIKMITDVNVNKLHQPWRSFAAVINKSGQVRGGVEGCGVGVGGGGGTEGGGEDEELVPTGVLDVLTYESDDEQISWKSSEEDDDDEVNVSEDDDDDMDKDEDDDADNQDDENPDDDDEQTDSDNDGDDFVYPKLSTHDNEAR
ncbi:hypothetical protein Tco_0767002 [Tanacetum coccineum]